jgi:hypothetical protein
VCAVPLRLIREVNEAGARARNTTEGPGLGGGKSGSVSGVLERTLLDKQHRAVDDERDDGEEHRHCKHEENQRLTALVTISFLNSDQAPPVPLNKTARFRHLLQSATGPVQRLNG